MNMMMTEIHFGIIPSKLESEEEQNNIKNIQEIEHAKNNFKKLNEHYNNNNKRFIKAAMRTW